MFVEKYSDIDLGFGSRRLKISSQILTFEILKPKKSSLFERIEREKREFEKFLL